MAVQATLTAAVKGYAAYVGGSSAALVSQPRRSARRSTAARLAEAEAAYPSARISTSGSSRWRRSGAAGHRARWPLENPVTVSRSSSGSTSSRADVGGRHPGRRRLRSAGLVQARAAAPAARPQPPTARSTWPAAPPTSSTRPRLRRSPVRRSATRTLTSSSFRPNVDGAMEVVHSAYALPADGRSGVLPLLQRRERAVASCWPATRPALATTAPATWSTRPCLTTSAASSPRR